MDDTATTNLHPDLQSVEAKYNSLTAEQKETLLQALADEYVQQMLMEECLFICFNVIYTRMKKISIIDVINTSKNKENDVVALNEMIDKIQYESFQSDQ